MDKLSALLHSQRIIVVSAEYSSFKTVWEILLKLFSQRSNRIVSSFWSRARFLSEIFLCGIEFDLVSVLTASNNKDWEQKEQKGQTQLFGLLLAPTSSQFSSKAKEREDDGGGLRDTGWGLPDSVTAWGDPKMRGRLPRVGVDSLSRLGNPAQETRFETYSWAGFKLFIKSINQLVAKTHKVRPLDENVTGWLWQNPKLYSFVAVSTR